MFEQYYDSRSFQEHLIPASEFHPFPKWGETVPFSEKQRAEMVAGGESVLGKEWPILRATDYMRFVTEGNRTIFEKPYFERRAGLLQLMEAEYAEQKGRFLPDLVDLLWAILEESTWVLPAHNALVEEYWNKWGRMYANVRMLPLHDPEHDGWLDLFAGTTGAQLSVLYYLFKEQLDEITPLLSRRIEIEVDRQLIAPFLRGYYSWSGLEKKTNNWNPWVVSNALTAAAFVCKDEEKRMEVITRACLLLDQFVRDYHSDGGCDEGPSYWGEAGAALGDCIDIMSDMTGGAMGKLFEEPLVKNILTYIYRVNMGGHYYTNYADCYPILHHSGVELYHFGQRIGDEMMMQFGAALNRDAEKTNAIQASNNSYRHLYRLSMQSELDKVEGAAPGLESVYLDGIQLIVERQERGDNDSLLLSAKAGHNGESHNHNDVGTFLLQSGGKPVLCDIGPGTYTANTFNEHRYELRQMQSSYHNVPEINGIAQKDGIEFTASEVSYTKENGVTVFAMDLAKAYPAECGAESWKRKFVYDRGERKLILQDCGVFRNENNRIDWTFITPVEPKLDGNEILFLPEETKPVRMTFDPALVAEFEKVEFPGDEKLLLAWGGFVYRVRISGTFGKECVCAFAFEQKSF